jgi:proline iminopeptidase
VAHAGGPGINADYLRMPALDQHLTMVYVDPIGTGASSLLSDGKYFIPTYSRFFEAVLDHIAEPQTMVLGHSHGGMVPLDLAISNPLAIGGLILYASTPVFGEPLWQESLLHIGAFVQRWPDRPEAVRAAEVWRVEVSDQCSNTAKDRQQALNASLPAYFADHRRTFDPANPPALNITWDTKRSNGTWSAVDRLKDIHVPTLIICGTHDFVCPPRWSKEMHAAIPNARLLELGDSGHFPHLEQQDEFVAGVAEFCKRCTEAG